MKAACVRSAGRWRTPISAACRDTGALLIADEVQCGLGRTGVPFYSSVLGLQPDLMALGKALGAGVPIGAAMFTDRVAAAAAPGDHGSTYGGNLLACRAALVFLEELVDRDLMGHVARVGAHLEAGLRAHRCEAAGRSRGPRRRTDVGPRARSAGPAGRRQRRCNWDCSSTARRTRWSGCCRRTSSRTAEIDEALGLLDQAIGAATESGS